MAPSEPPVEADLPFPDPQIPGVYKRHEWQEAWGVIVEHLTDKERARCEVWKDEVQNLLIFSGLFSAVVTGFLVESQKSLTENPSDVLLTRIAVASEQAANATVPPSIITPFIPGYTDKVINSLWFLSLVLSLTTALVGVVSLQWLREHLRPSTFNTPLKTLPAMIQMQADSLDAYFIPQLFTALPVFQILALVFFFLGLIQFLWTLNHAVAYPSIIIISLTLAFMLYTTLRPGLQGLPHFHQEPPIDQPGSQPTMPCPYRSPQSWALLQAMHFLSPISSALSTPLLPLLLRSKPLFRSIYAKISFPLPRARSTLPLESSNWIEWTRSWLRARDIKYVCTKEGLYSLGEQLNDPRLTFPPIYDSLCALLQTKRDFSMAGNKERDKMIKPVLLAFNDFLNFDQCSQGFSPQLSTYCREVMEQSRNPAHRSFYLPSSFFKGTGGQTQQDEARLLFELSASMNLNDISNTVSKSLYERIPRLVLASCEKWDSEINLEDSCCSPLALLWYEASVDRLLENAPDALIRVLEKLMTHATTLQAAGTLKPDNLGTSPYVKSTLQSIANILVNTFNQKTPGVEKINQLHSKHNTYLSALNKRLQSQPSNAYLFLLASVYLHYLLGDAPPQFRKRPMYKGTEASNEVVRTLEKQHARLSDDPQLRQYQEWIMPCSLQPGFTWAYLDPRYVKVEVAAKEVKDVKGSEQQRKGQPQPSVSTATKTAQLPVQTSPPASQTIQSSSQPGKLSTLSTPTQSPPKVDPNLQIKKADHNAGVAQSGTSSLPSNEIALAPEAPGSPGLLDIPVPSTPNLQSDIRTPSKLGVSDQTQASQTEVQLTSASHDAIVNMDAP